MDCDRLAIKCFVRKHRHYPPVVVLHAWAKNIKRADYFDGDAIFLVVDSTNGFG